jgi:hypothetical protein
MPKNCPACEELSKLTSSQLKSLSKKTRIDLTRLESAARYRIQLTPTEVSRIAKLQELDDYP